MKKFGLIVNPYAGAGGRIGLKGSDKFKIENPELPLRIRRFLRKLCCKEEIYFITPRFKMGEIYLKEFEFYYSVIDIGSNVPTSRIDTINAAKMIKNEGIELLIFVGGDGTARDLLEGLGGESNLPVLGIPAGVKMYSGIFANTPEAAAILVNEFLKGRAKIEKAEIIDVDEDLLRSGKFELKLYGYLPTISFGEFLTPTKQEVVSSTESLDEIADFVIEQILEKDEEYYFVFGPGSTVNIY
ncbi:MAG: NAD(+)/NADH kinase, partial [Sulfolobaceae archaeon]